MITLLLRVFLFLAVLMFARGIYRAWRVESSRGRERRQAAESGRYNNLSDQDVSDADFEEIPKDK
ncbi:MAG: hypothetical protein IPI48_07035 [bacterium]|jgi:hypothetical protein|nr:hypothetical protein [bacterium]MBK7671706.1 hypothetical protein [bacterium]MBK7770272.1 hypothetical protein [bacterium]